MTEQDKEIFEKYCKLEEALRIAKDALREASEYHNTDDVNGEAGYICYKALDKIDEVLK